MKEQSTLLTYQFLFTSEVNLHVFLPLLTTQNISTIGTSLFPLGLL